MGVGAGLGVGDSMAKAGLPRQNRPRVGDDEEWAGATGTPLLLRSSVTSDCSSSPLSTSSPKPALTPESALRMQEFRFLQVRWD